MNGIGMTMLIVVLATAALAVWWIVQRRHRFTTRTGLDEMGKAVAGAIEAHEQLSSSQVAPVDEATSTPRPTTEPAPQRDVSGGDTP